MAFISRDTGRSTFAATLACFEDGLTHIQHFESEDAARAYCKRTGYGLVGGEYRPVYELVRA